MVLARVACAFVLPLAAVLVPAPDQPPAAQAADEGYTSLFNGKDLAGWVNVNCHPDTFYVKNGEIITTGKPTGFLRTEKQYENFVLEMDWMHINKKEVGNSGLFVWGDPLPAVGTGYTRGIEVQVLVNLEYRDKKTNAITATSHGDLFSIWGAKCVPDRPHPLGWERCLPSENRAKGGGEWNHYKVTANNGVIKLEVNGKEVSGVSQCNPRKGYLALESEDAECHFKNIRIKELPTTNPKPEECAKVADGHVSLFDGIDLSGWKAEDSWKAANGKLVSKGSDEIYRARRQTGSFAGYGELIVDWKLPLTVEGRFGLDFGSVKLTMSPDGSLDLARVEDNPKGGVRIRGDAVKVADPKRSVWHRTIITSDDQRVVVNVDGKQVINVPALKHRTAASVAIRPVAGLEIMNVFFREPKEKK